MSDEQQTATAEHIEMANIELPPAPQLPVLAQAAPPSVYDEDISRLERIADKMAGAGIAVPPHCREQPNTCFAILLHCEQWRIRNPIFIANHSYVVRQRKRIAGTEEYQVIDTLAFDATVFHAIIAASGLIDITPDYAWDGSAEDGSRTCTVTVVRRDNGKVISYTTPRLDQCRPETFVKDGTRYSKGSQLWITNPDQQLAYFGIRNLARLYFPLALGGIYDRDEFEEVGPEHAKDITAATSVIERLRDRGITGEDSRGFAGKAATKAALRDDPEAGTRPAPRASATKAKAAKPAKPTPVAKPVRRKKPKTEDEYREHVAAWLSTKETIGAVRAQWSEERGLRNDIGFTSETRAPIQAMVDARIEELR